eukprot:TRINITY_DN46941_c0_g1_i1.p1 TRINITY_DN46941_c0_g1~~TRINITY_DN46941_c0_g1_i1.p1  ORF type:complete len:508 (-),score=89.73 TRINITY_DN46941_c0_g1_i1:23-1546(-)
MSTEASTATDSADVGEAAAQTQLWQGVAIVSLFALVLALAAGVFVYVWHQQQHRGGTSGRSGGAEHTEKKAWDDPERGGESPSSRRDRRDGPSESTSALRDGLRQILAEEISRGLRGFGLENRLDRLEHKDEAPLSLERAKMSERLDFLERQVLDRALLPGTACSDLPGLPPQPQRPAPPTGAAPVAPVPVGRPPAPDTPPPAVQPSIGRLTLDVGTITDPPASAGTGANAGRYRGFGSPMRPRRTSNCSEAQLNSLRRGLLEAQRELYKKDTRTSMLTRHLRELQKQYWQQTVEERSASKRLRDILCDVSRGSAAPTLRAQAAELISLCSVTEDLSSRLSDAKAGEAQWSAIVKRQSAYHMQNESRNADGFTLLKRHPAGEVFGAEEEHRRLLCPDEHDGVSPQVRAIAAAGAAGAMRQFGNQCWEDDDGLDDFNEDDDEDSLWEESEDNFAGAGGAPRNMPTGGRGSSNPAVFAHQQPAVVEDEGESEDEMGDMGKGGSATARSL